MKREARIIVAGECNGLLVGIVLRGPHRVEHVIPARSVEEMASLLRESGIGEEVRYAHPPSLAERLGVSPLHGESLERYMGSCSACMRLVVGDLCSIVLSLH